MSKQPDNHIDEKITPKVILQMYADVDPDELGEDKFIGHYDLEKSIQQLDQYYADFYRNKILEAERKSLDKSLALMKEILQENFHYRIMCGEIKHPSSQENIHQMFVDYQELEPEREKFADYVEKRVDTITAQFNSKGNNDE